VRQYHTTECGKWQVVGGKCVMQVPRKRSCSKGKTVIE
jgi:hypothetical protein